MSPISTPTDRKLRRLHKRVRELKTLVYRLEQKIDGHQQDLYDLRGLRNIAVGIIKRNGEQVDLIRSD